MMQDELGPAKALTAWKDRVRDAWPNVTVKDIALKSPAEVPVGEAMRVEVVAQLGALTPDDVAVELYHGPTAGGHELAKGRIVRMKLAEKLGDGAYRFTGDIPAHESGAHAFAARIMPWNAAMSHPYETSLVRWA
jgi:starch phosphorylase